VSRESRTWAAAIALPILACAAWAIAAGKDLNWDLLHYHYYIGAAFAEGRLGQDYFAASSQSYLNPLGYLPFFFMVHAGWHAVIVAMTLAAAHAMNVTLLFVIGRQLLPGRDAWDRNLLAALAALVGVASAVFWAMVGTSFVDILLTVPMLGGVALLLGGEKKPSARHAALAGVLFGLAASLKYSNAFFALAGCVLAARAFLPFAAGGVAGVALFAGPWLWRMQRDFGNPFFPHFNAWFHSPDFLPINLAAGRYVPPDLLGFLSFPLHMMSAESLTYAEISAPDVRIAALALLAVAAAVSARLAGRTAAALESRDVRLLAFFALSLAAWIATSANARYGLLVLLLAGPCVMRLADRALPQTPCRVTLLVLIVLQAAMCAINSPARWFVAERWSRHWFPYVVPSAAAEKPAVYLTVETQSMAVIAPFLDRESTLVNLRGQKEDTPGWQRIVAPRIADGTPVRTLGRGLRLGPDGTPRKEVVQGYASTLDRFGWRVDATMCFDIDWRPDDGDALSRWANALAGDPPSRQRLFSLGSCALVRAPRDERKAAQEAYISRIFDRIEHACPRLFRGQTAVTDRYGTEWSRTYTGLDARLETNAGHAVLSPFFKLVYYDLGTLTDWEKDPMPSPAPCEK
jgi:hypothetical protein